MKKSILILSGCLGMLCLSLLAACSKDEEGTNPPDDGGGDNEEEVVDGDDEEDAVLTLSLDSITVDSGAGRQTVELTSNNEWEIDNPSSEWISISPSQGQAGTVTLTVDVSENQSYDRRIHVFNITAGDEEASLTVSQKQIGYLSLYTASNVFYDEGGICEVLVTTSVEYEIEYTDNGREWVSMMQTKAFVNNSVSFRIAEYTGDSQRECDIIFKEQGGELRDTVHITQYHDKALEFEDSYFKNYLLVNYDVNGDGKFTKQDADNITSLDIVGQNVKSLAGIEALENLVSLHCSFCNISELDVSGNSKLFALYCSNNSLQTLDVSRNNALQALWCENNQLTELRLGDQDFEVLNCENNLLTSLGTPETPLKVSQSIYCENNLLENLYITQGQDWGVVISCSNNNLKYLDLSSVPDLTSLSCSDNDISQLNLTNLKRLQTLSCSDNELSTIDVSDCLILSMFSISSNPLQSITISSDQESMDWFSGTFGVLHYYPDIEVIIR